MIADKGDSLELPVTGSSLSLRKSATEDAPPAKRKRKQLGMAPGRARFITRSAAPLPRYVEDCGGKRRLVDKVVSPELPSYPASSLSSPPASAPTDKTPEEGKSAPVSVTSTHVPQSASELDVVLGSSTFTDYSAAFTRFRGAPRRLFRLQISPPLGKRGRKRPIRAYAETSQSSTPPKPNQPTQSSSQQQPPK